MTQKAASRQSRTCRSRSTRRRLLGERAGEQKAAHRIVGIDLGQHRTRLVAIFAHLLRKRLWRGEGRIGTEEGDELDLDLLSVEIAGKVEQVGLEHQLALAEGGTRADITGSVVAAAVMVDAHGIDAVAHVLTTSELKIERGEAEPFAAPGARPYAPAHPPPIAELVRRLSYFAVAEMLADAARRERGSGGAYGRDHVDAEACL